MNNIVDHSILMRQMFGKKSGVSSLSGGVFQLSDINSRAVQSQLKAAGIDTSSAQYKAVMNNITKAGKGGSCCVNIQGIKNQMKNYDSNGDYIDPTTGLTGLLVTDENIGGKNRIIDIPESSRDEMFELAKREFLRENGVSNGETTKRSDVYTNMYHKVAKKDRLAAGHTLNQYERAYAEAFTEAARKADKNWKPGMPIRSGALDSITRQDIEKNLARSGNTLIRRTIDYKA